MNAVDTLTWVETRLSELPQVTCRPEFGTRTYFVGGARFAALTGNVLVTHLPPAELIAALKARIARPFVSVGAMGRNGWVELRLDGVDPDLLDRYLVAAHAAAVHAHRRTLPKRPAAARRTRPARRLPG